MSVRSRPLEGLDTTPLTPTMCRTTPTSSASYHREQGLNSIKEAAHEGTPRHEEGGPRLLGTPSKVWEAFKAMRMVGVAPGDELGWRLREGVSVAPGSPSCVAVPRHATGQGVAGASEPKKEAGKKRGEGRIGANKKGHIDSRPLRNSEHEATRDATGGHPKIGAV